MLILNAEQIAALAPMARVIECLEDVFSKDLIVPPRQIENMPGGGGARSFFIMPAFDKEGGAVVKLATLFPDNARKGLPTIQAAILIFSAQGTPMALLDGTIVTRLRTAAASGLASKYLSRGDSTHLVVIGTGALVPFMAEAHCAVRPINKVTIWGRSFEHATEAAAATRRRLGSAIDVSVSGAIREAVLTADIISCATGSSTPVLAGKWLTPGTFVDLVGSFSPSKREADDDVVARARIFVDTFEGGLSEAGDIIDPLRRGVMARSDIEGELADLVHGRVAGRTNNDEIIMFKSVGTAIEDLAASQLVMSAFAESQLEIASSEPL